MSKSIIQTIGEAIQQKIENGTFTVPIQVRRNYLPRYEASEDVPKQAPFVVHVVPASMTNAEYSRDVLSEVTYEFDVAVLGYIGENQREQKIDTLILLVEQIQNLITDTSNREIATDIWLTNPAYSMDSIYDPSALREHRVFFSVTTFSFRVQRGS